MSATTMRAVGFTRSLPINDDDSLLDFETARPEPGPSELLVRVIAASVNPADTKKRRRLATDRVLDEPVILGFDGVGTVERTGSQVTRFKPGDEVWYAGNIQQPGCNAEFQVIDERVAACRPRSLTPAEAVSLPLTAVTAWEVLFDRMLIPERGGNDRTILIIGGAGGVGSSAIQIARKVAGMHVIATASREETAEWCRTMGAHEIADHRDLITSVRALGHDTVPYILNCADTSGHWDAMSELIAPEGRIGSVVETDQPVDLTSLMLKSALFAWENMSTRPIFRTATLPRQGEILEQIAAMVDRGELRSTLTRTLHGLSADTLRQAHAALESGTMIGKLAVVY